MRNRSKINTKSLPFTVVYQVNGINKMRRFKESESAWNFMRLSNGFLNMAFRTL